MSTYVFDAAWQKERDRLAGLEDLFDESSFRHLTRLGATRGRLCLEVGGGAGGVAFWLSDIVGDTGHVLVTDLDTRFLDGHGRANVQVLVHNVVTDRLPERTFDIVHARAVLEHLPEREDVLARIVAATRPGGWILIEDTDFGGSTAAALAGYVSAAPEVVGAAERIFRGVAALFGAAGADPSFGRRLPATLAAAGLINIGAEVRAPLVCGGTENWTRGTVEHLADKMISANLATAADIEWFLDATARTSTVYAPPLMVSAWGQRPTRPAAAR